MRLGGAVKPVTHTHRPNKPLTNTKRVGVPTSPRMPPEADKALQILTRTDPQLFGPHGGPRGL